MLDIDRIKWKKNLSGEKYITFIVPHSRRGIMTYEPEKRLILQKKRIENMIRKNLKLSNADKIKFDNKSIFLSWVGVDAYFKINNEKNEFNIYSGSHGKSSARYYIDIVK